MGRRITTKNVTYHVTVALFFFLVILPLLYVAWGSFVKEGVLSSDNYLQVLTLQNIRLLLKSIAVALSVSVIATINGGFFGFVLTKTDLPAKNILKLILLIPLLLPPYIYAVSWMDLSACLAIKSNIAYSSPGVIFIQSIIFSPLAMIIISNGLSNLNQRFEESGLMITTYPKVLMKIILPLIKPSIISSLILIFVLSISEFSVPAFLSVNLFVTEIFTQFSAFYNYGAAVADSMVLVILCFLLLMTERLYLSDAPFFALSTRSSSFKIICLKKGPLYLLLFTTFISISMSVLIPLAVLLLQSFSNGMQAFTDALSLMISPAVHSLLYAVTGALILVISGFVIACISEREGKKFVDMMLLITFGIPSTVLGIALIRFFNTPYLDFIYSSMWIIISGYIGRFLFVSEKLIANSIRQIPRSFEEAADLAGATFYCRIRRILLPLISDGMFGTFLICFIFCIGELGTTILVYPPGTSIMPIKVFTIMANAPQSLTSSMCLVVLIISISALVVFSAGKKIISRR